MDKSNEEYSSYVDLKTKLEKAIFCINESKRAQDLVAKYLKKSNSNDSSSSKSVSKKVQTLKKYKDRFSLQLYKSFGWTQNEIDDEEFNKIESNYCGLENALRSYFNDLNSFLTNLKVKIIKFSHI